MFSLSKEQNEKLKVWLDEQWAKFPKNEHGLPSVGAIGGAVTYSFTPTTLGTVVKVKMEGQGEIDLSDYENW